MRLLNFFSKNNAKYVLAEHQIFLKLFNMRIFLKDVLNERYNDTCKTQNYNLGLRLTKMIK